MARARIATVAVVALMALVHAPSVAACYWWRNASESRPIPRDNMFFLNKGEAGDGR